LKAAEKSHEVEKIKQLNHELDKVGQRYLELKKASEFSEVGWSAGASTHYMLWRCQSNPGAISVSNITGPYI
jgi:hypothetical protein